MKTLEQYKQGWEETNIVSASSLIGCDWQDLDQYDSVFLNENGHYIFKHDDGTFSVQCMQFETSGTLEECATWLYFNFNCGECEEPTTQEQVTQILNDFCAWKKVAPSCITEVSLAFMTKPLHNRSQDNHISIQFLNWLEHKWEEITA